MTTPVAVSHARHLLVQGRVQGVGFRWFVRERARRLALKGWVRNREDGTVELAVAGPLHALDQLVLDIAIGPPGAQVQGVQDLVPLSSTDDDHGDATIAQALPFPFVIQR